MKCVQPKAFLADQAPECQKGRVLFHNNMEGKERHLRATQSFATQDTAHSYFPHGATDQTGPGIWGSRAVTAMLITGNSSIFLRCKMDLNDTTFSSGSCQNRKQDIMLAFEVTSSTFLLEVFILLRSAIMNWVCPNEPGSYTSTVNWEVCAIMNLLLFSVFLPPFFPLLFRHPPSLLSSFSVFASSLLFLPSFFFFPLSSCLLPSFFLCILIQKVTQSTALRNMDPGTTQRPSG